jgi:histidinol-phosphate aminotransferase
MCPDTLVVIDESYWGYSGTGDAHLKGFLQNYPNAMILRTFSKFFGLPGLRIGYGFVHSKHEVFIRYANRYLGFNRLAEEMALAALDSFDYYQGVSRVIEAEKQRYYSELRPLDGVRVYDSQANFVMIELPQKAKAKLKANIEKNSIVIRFLEDMGLENHFRVSVGKPEVNTLVVQCIRDAVASL